MGLKRKHHPTHEEQSEEIPTSASERLAPLSERSPPLPAEVPVPHHDDFSEQPPLPDEPPPSLSDETASMSDGVSSNNKSPTQSAAATTAAQVETDGWKAIWEPTANAYYFYNSETKESTWLNPRLPPEEAAAYLAAHPPTLDPTSVHSSESHNLLQPSLLPTEVVPESVYDTESGNYAFTAHFNAKTGKFQNNPEHTAENFSTEGQLLRTAKEYFDIGVMSQGKVVGKSGGALKAERKSMKIPKAQLKELIRRKREKKDRNKREWLANDD